MSGRPPPLPRPPLPEHHCRRAVRALVWVGLGLIAFNLLAVAGRLDGEQREVAITYLQVNLSGQAASLLLNLWLLARPHRSERVYRIGAAACGAIFAVTMTSSLWVQGSVTSSAATYLAMLIVAAWRVYYDRTVGLVVLAVMVVSHAALVGLEVAGVITPHPLAPALGDPAYASASAQWSAFAGVLLRYALTWAVATVVANRFARAEVALRAAEDAHVALRARVSELERLARAGAGHGSTADEGRLSRTTLAGAYALGARLGAGGMGEVYAARRLTDGADVAVKVLHPHLAMVPRLLERFRREAETAGRLPSGRVARVLEIGASPEGHHFIVMERLVGEDLEVRLTRAGALAPAEVLRVTRALAEVLDAAHALGLVHRDLKPSNVFLGDGGDVRLLDFGIVRSLEASQDGEQPALTSTAMILGTPGYLAPEQALGSGEVGPAADVFALGAVVYRALTGQPAFSAGNRAVALFEVVHKDPPPPSERAPHLSPAVDAVLAVALAKAPARRFASAGELAEALERALDGAVAPALAARAASLPASASADTLADGHDEA